MSPTVRRPAAPKPSVSTHGSLPAQQRVDNPVKVTTPKSLKEQLPADWRKALSGEFDKPYFKQLEKFLAEERKTHSVLPPADKVFAALEHTPLSKVKVVLIGQDPY